MPSRRLEFNGGKSPVLKSWVASMRRSRKRGSNEDADQPPRRGGDNVKQSIGGNISLWKENINSSRIIARGDKRSHTKAVWWQENSGNLCLVASIIFFMGFSSENQEERLTQAEKFRTKLCLSQGAYPVPNTKMSTPKREIPELLALGSQFWVHRGKGQVNVTQSR